MSSSPKPIRLDIFVYAKKPISRRASLRRRSAYSRLSLSILWNLGPNRMDRRRFIFCVERVPDFRLAVSGTQGHRISQFQAIHITAWPEDLALVLPVLTIRCGLLVQEAVQPSG
jgi:hypothetical protein